MDTITLPTSYSHSYVICGGSIFEKPNADYTESFYDLTLAGFSYYLDPYGTWESKEINWITVGFLVIPLFYNMGKYLHKLIILRL